MTRDSSPRAGTTRSNRAGSLLLLRLAIKTDARSLPLAIKTDARSRLPAGDGRARPGHARRGAVFAVLLACLGSASAQLAPAFPVQDFVANPPGSYTLPVIQSAPDGWVLEGNRWPRRLSRYTRGAVTLLSFVYTYCSDPVGCPLAYATFVDVRERVAADPSLRGKVRLVSLSFDPTHDTPLAMRHYGGEYARAREPRWHFLTASSMHRLEPILAGFGQDVEVERDASGKPTRARTHLLKVFLIDSAGKVREIYGAAFLHPEVVYNDIKTIALESFRSPPTLSVRASSNAAGQAAHPGAARAAPVRDYGDAFGLPPLELPAAIVLDSARIELGRKLFFDRRLSANGTMSCAMCHVPEQGFASNASRTAVGLAGRSLRRNAPSLLNVAWQPLLFHDGREASLPGQAWQPLLHADEMGNDSAEQVLKRIRGLRDYDSRFERAFRGAPASVETVGAALAAFQASLVSANSRFDRWRFGGDADALSVIEQRGFAVFSGKGRCSACHAVGERHALLADGRFHVTGAGRREARSGQWHVVTLAPGVQTRLSDTEIAVIGGQVEDDAGRFEVTGAPVDRYAFRTASLRNVSRTAPYMHDGSLATLADVVEFYERGGNEAPGKSPLLGPLGLSSAEKDALVAFLLSLDGANVDALAASSRSGSRRGVAEPGR